MMKRHLLARTPPRVTATGDASFGLELVTALPAYGAEPGDRLLIRVGHPEAIVLHRVLPPGYGAVAEALRAGVARPLNPQRQSEDLIAALGERPYGPLRSIQGSARAGRAQRATPPPALKVVRGGVR